MEEIRSFFFDFCAGKISVPAFIEHCEAHPEVLDFLTAAVAKNDGICKNGVRIETIIYGDKINDEGVVQKNCVIERIPFDARLSFEILKNFDCETTYKHYNIYQEFRWAVRCAFRGQEREIGRNERLSNEYLCKYNFTYYACPSYIGGGTAVDALLKEIEKSIPEDLSRTKRVKLFKNRIKETFHIDSNKYPRWIQSPEWPLGEDGVPMKFISQKRGKGKEYDTMLYTEFLFEDVKTGEKKTVAQFT